MERTDAAQQAYVTSLAFERTQYDQHLRQVVPAVRDWTRLTFGRSSDLLCDFGVTPRRTRGSVIVLPCGHAQVPSIELAAAPKV
jgi:hypothetical protein